MWIRVALKKDSMHLINNNGSYSMSYIEGSDMQEYYFDENIAELLEDDGFLMEMWEKLDVLFDWGDCDFFLPDKCIVFKEWLETRLEKECNKDIKKIYEIMLDYVNKAIENDTGISFDF